MAMKTVGIPALGIWSRILGPGAGLDVMLSDDETLHVANTGMFPATRHVSRTLGVKTAWLREVFKPPEYRLHYQPRSGQCSDIIAKSNFSVASWRHSCDLIGILPCEVMSSGRGGGNAPPEPDRKNQGCG